jgi:hypothetical protein
VRSGFEIVARLERRTFQRDLLGMATAPRYTPGGFPITLNTRSDNRSDNTTDDRSNEQPGQRITIENADEHLHWLPEHSVIIC